MVKHAWYFMVRFLGVAALGLRRFRPSVHLYPPLVLLSCLVASTTAPAVGYYGHDDLAELQELRELLVPGFGREPEVLIGIGGITLSNPVTGTVVPAFQLASSPGSSSGEDSTIDGFVVPSGFFLARSGVVPGRGGFRLTNPLAFRWTGTATTQPLQLTWQAGTLFDNVFDGTTGGFVPFRILTAGLPVPGEPDSNEPSLSIVAEASSEDPEPADQPADVFENALLPPGTEANPDIPSDAPGPSSGDQANTAEDPEGQGPDGTPVPGPLPMAGLVLAWRCSRRLRQRVRQLG